ncbi:MAG: dTDP-4-dehydrorhamnose 3,5-epimerase family protein, partial [Bacteroidota bacterium]
MIFEETKLKGAFVITPEPHVDERGQFARTFCKREFEAHGLCSNFVQMNHSKNSRAGTVRGLHYQLPPYCEVKLVRCVRGMVLDAIIDIRRDSPTFLQHFTVYLSDINQKMLYIPEGFAHGFRTLEPT